MAASSHFYQNTMRRKGKPSQPFTRMPSLHIPNWINIKFDSILFLYIKQYQEIGKDNWDPLGMMWLRKQGEGGPLLAGMTMRFSWLMHVIIASITGPGRLMLSPNKSTD